MIETTDFIQLQKWLRVKRVSLLTVCLMVVFLQANARTIFVKAIANGNGASWSNAFGDLQQALKSAKAGDEIWVAAGVYTPTKNNDRMVSFSIPSGIKMFGGFAGNETAVQQRNIQSNPTTLSGEIGTISQEDNSYTIIYTRHAGSDTEIDGFIISGGHANGIGSIGDMKVCGGAWFNDGSNGESSPIVRNCIFQDNVARNGAAIYNFAKNGVCNPMIENCLFTGNSADLDGGAIFNDGNSGVCNPVINKCNFTRNAATYGACILNVGKNGQCRPLINESAFTNNTSLVRGSVVYNHREQGSNCEATMTSCRTDDNDSMVGKEVSNTLNGENSNVEAKKTGKTSGIRVIAMGKN